MISQSTIQHEAIGSTKQFLFSSEKRFTKKRFHNLIRKLFIVVPLAVKNSFVFRVDLREVDGNVRIVRKQSVRVVLLLSVDVHFNIGKNLVENVVYMCNEKN